MRLYPFGFDIFGILINQRISDCVTALLVITRMQIEHTGHLELVKHMGIFKCNAEVM